jgi:hypothetical protein
MTTTEKKITVIDQSRGSESRTALEKELRVQSDRIRIANQNIGANFFDVGVALKKVRDGKLYRYGDPALSSFAEYVEKMGISRQTGYNLVFVAESLSRDDAVEFGPTLSYVIARPSDEGCRKELMTMARNGASASQLKKQEALQRLKAGKKSKSPGRPKEKEKVAGPTRVHGAGQTTTPVVDKDELKVAKHQRVNRELPFIGDRKILDLVAPADERKKKAGWLVTEIKLGNDAVIHVEVNVSKKKKLLKYRIEVAS